MKQLLMLSVAFALGSCGAVDGMRDRFGAREAKTVRVARPSDLPGTAAAQTAAALDGTSEAEKTAALSAGASGGTELGEVVVALGSPTEQGFWLRSSLVAVPAKGRVVTDEGASIAVDLLPGTGGALLSLPAFRALGLPLTGLPTVTVYSN